MKYDFIQIPIHKLVDDIETNRIDLNPSYQRNFIWSTKDQQDLVDTILSGYPLPNFFLYLKPNGLYEMVDGQQRSKTIYRFVKGHIKSGKKTGNKSFEDVKDEAILNYQLPFVVITDLKPNESLNDFYVLINKKGRLLNTAEIHKSEYHDTNFLRLANEVLTYQAFINLNLFTDASNKRMVDREFVEELLVYLKFGITEKKKSIEETYEADIDEKDYQTLQERFYKVIDIAEVLNQFYPINKSRYKQKNDFYTLFNFLNENLTQPVKIILYQYEILLELDKKDNDGRQFIRPTNESCSSLKEYAINCVSQSNSKVAREKRLSFFNAILKNTDIKGNQILADVLNFLSEIYGEQVIDLTKVGPFELLNINLLKSSKV